MSRNVLPQSRWLVCYDIHQPRRRRRVAARLEGAGRRTQKSVFIVEHTPDQMATLMARCRAQLEPGDSLRAHRLLQPTMLACNLGAPLRLPGYWIC